VKAEDASPTGVWRLTTGVSDRSEASEATMARRFDIAIVGCGGVAEMHFQAYSRHPERVRDVAACDLEAARAEAAGQRWEIPTVFASLPKMIHGARWEVAVVCTPTPCARRSCRNWPLPASTCSWSNARSSFPAKRCRTGDAAGTAAQARHSLGTHRGFCCRLRPPGEVETKVVPRVDPRPRSSGMLQQLCRIILAIAPRPL